MLYTGSVTTLQTHIKRIGGEYHPHPLYNSSRLRSKFEPEPNVGLRSRSGPSRITVKFGVHARKNLPEPEANRTSRPLLHATDAGNHEQRKALFDGTIKAMAERESAAA
jgi:hypothetical protein